MFFVYDLIAVVILIAVIAVGYKRGFSGSVIGIVSILASFLGAFITANIFAPIIYEACFSESIKESVYSALPQSNSINDFISSLPEGLSFVIKDSAGQIAKFVESGKNNAAVSIISIIEPVITELIRSVIFFISVTFRGPWIRRCRNCILLRSGMNGTVHSFLTGRTMRS